jgi:hypothetical protein
VSFHEVHDLAAAAAQADFCLLVEALEAGFAGVLVGLLVLLRGSS